MAVVLGIDTGGTYTDAVLVDQESDAVLEGTKALTTRHDLSIGIGEAVTGVIERAVRCGRAISPSEIGLVGLSTTLATNAIVEGQGTSVCLLLIGYKPELIQRYGFERDLVTQDVVYLTGGHNGDGNETAPLDEASAREAISARSGRVDAFAVSGYFGVRNPDHELRVRALVEELMAPAEGQEELPAPVTCGHELTTRLDSVRRATTAALNARLIPLLRELIATVRSTLDGLGIAAPLMIVKGDGSLVRAEWAMRRPIETILSGPAASVVGAWHLAGHRDMWVVDVGGTTTDIAVLSDGRPRLNPEGAQVGGWRTMIETADVHTVGLGGDSHVRLTGEPFMGPDGLTIGPRRAVPLCLLADEHPGIVGELRRQVAARKHMNLVGEFAVYHGQVSASLSEEDRKLLGYLSDGPRSLIFLTERMRYGLLDLPRIGGLEAQRLILRAAFTPTDALHVLGRFERWDTEASRLGAELLAMQVNASPEAVCERVIAEVSDRLTRELVGKVLNDEGSLPDWKREPSALALLDRAMGKADGSDLACRLTLCRPVVAVGAPVEAYLPRTARQLNTELAIPRRAEVANAMGAVAGGVVQRQQVLIRPLEGDGVYRLHLPDGVRDFSSVREGVAYAEETVPDRLMTLARQAGADHVEVKMDRVDHTAPVAMGLGEEVFVETVLLFTAVGRPSMAREGGELKIGN